MVWFWRFCVFSFVGLLSSYVIASFILHDLLRSVEPETSTNTPTAFTVDSSYWHSDEVDYLLKSFEAVSFSPRSEPGLLQGWFIPASSNKVVIVVHGLASSMASAKALITASLLHQSGFNVLLFDTRDHGSSFIEDSKTALGTNEYLDILGAWDFLISHKQFSAAQIGITGGSLGAVTMLIAAGEEPAIHSLFLDSPFSDHLSMIQEELSNKGYPSLLAYGGLAVSKYLYNSDLLDKPIDAAIEKSQLKRVFLTHRSQDDRISIHHSKRIREQLLIQDIQHDLWIVSGTGHVMSQFDYPMAYKHHLKQFFDSALSSD